MSDEADRLIAGALRDHARVAAPARLHHKLARRHLGKRRPWIVPGVAALAGAAVATLIMLLVIRPAAPSVDLASEAVGDHLRMLNGRGLGVEVSDMHQVKPWFTGKLEFVPPITFLGDDEFVLAGGDVAVFLGHKAAELVYHRRLHVISLFVFQTAGAFDHERTVQGFHAILWTKDGFGFALVSDLNFAELRTLRERL